MIPEFVNGFLPVSDDPHPATIDEVAASFCHTEERARAWQSFVKVRSMLLDFLPQLAGCEWWLHGSFVTASADASSVEAMLIIPWPATEDGLSQAGRLLLTIATDGQSLQPTMMTRLQVARRTDPVDYDQVQQRCGFARLRDGDESRPTGWVRLR